MMMPGDLYAIRSRIGVTQAQMSEWLACDPVGYKRYEGGKRPIPRYIERSAIMLDFIHGAGQIDRLSELLAAREAEYKRN